MASSHTWIVLVLLNFRLNAGDVRLDPSRRATESIPLNLTCVSNQSELMRFFKDGALQGFCSATASCRPFGSSYRLERVGLNTILIIDSVNSIRDQGSWYCQLGTVPPTNSTPVVMTTIASMFNWTDIQLNLEWNTRISVTPDENIILTMTTPCTKPAPNFAWKYRVDQSGSFTDLSSTFSSTSESASGCPSGQKKYTNTLTLPGNTVSFYDKKITLRVAVEHDSFDPSENYIKYRDSGSTQFPVRVSSVSISPSNNRHSMFEGKTITFVCTTSPSFPSAIVTWYKGGTQLPGTVSSTSPSSGVLVTTTSRLKYKANRTDHSHKIYCRASNSATPNFKQSNQVELNIFYPPSKPVIIVPNEVCAGSQSSLTCLSLDLRIPQANYQWTTDGNNVNTGVTSDGSVWTFIPSKDDNEANIRCSAGNTYTERPGYSRVQSDATTLKVYYTPVLTVTGNLTRREGQDLSLTCRSDPQDAVVNWSTRSGQGSALTLRNLSRGDDRNYTCHGTFSEVCIHLQNSTVVHVTVNYAPDITYFNSVTIDEGQSLTLSCQADGRPSLFEFKPFAQYWGDLQVRVHAGIQSGAVYNWTLTNANYLDTGEYECNVNNGIPDRNNALDQRKRVKVFVRGKPVVTPDCSQEVSAEVGSTVHLCQTFYTSGFGITSYNWTFDKSRVLGVSSTSQTKVTLVKNGVRGNFDGFNVTLVITDAKQEGFYTVNVCSVFGCGFSKVNLMSQGPPLTPVNFTMVFKAPSSVVLRWVPNFSGGIGLVQTFILQHRAQGSAEWKNTTVDIDQDQIGGHVFVQVTGLQPGTKYEFRVMARNNRLQNNEGRFTALISGKTSEDQTATSSSLVLGILLGFTLLVTIALAVAVIKMYRDKSAVNIKGNSNNDTTRRPERENQSASAHPGYESLDDITPPPYAQLHVNQGSTVNEQAGYLTLVQDPPVTYETVALHEYENTKSKGDNISTIAQCDVQEALKEKGQNSLRNDRKRILTEVLYHFVHVVDKQRHQLLMQQPNV